MSRRYQSGIGKALHAHAAYAQAGKVHALRGVYAQACAHLFDWGGGMTPNAICMLCLGHVGIEESLAYTTLLVDMGTMPRASLGAFRAA